MNALAGFRANVAAALDAAGVRTTDHLPSVIGPTPAAILQHGSPYLELSDTQTWATIEVRARLAVRLLADPSTDNAAATTDLDPLLPQALPALLRSYGDAIALAEPDAFVQPSTPYLPIVMP